MASKLFDRKDLSQQVKPPRLVVAIDFGTFASGYAYQWRTDYESNRLKITRTARWPVASTDTYKTPTCLLLKPDKSLDSFGYEAEEKFARLHFQQEGSHGAKDFYYFRYFKMMLHDCNNLTEAMQVEDAASAKHLPAIVVFRESIRYMRNHFLKNLEESGTPNIEEETQWVLTVPAIWNDRAKHMMRKAAEQAGIPGNNLLIALEPEAAAIYCSQIPRNQLEVQNVQGKLVYVCAPESTVMVVDMGGGTVDITVVKIGTDGKMKQVHQSEGGACGGMKVNENFVHMMHDLVGRQVWEDFALNCAVEENEMRQEVETQKRKVTKGSTSPFRVTLPIALMEKWTANVCGKDINQAINDKPKFANKVRFQHGKLVFDGALISGLFDVVLRELLDLVKKVIRDCKTKKISLDAVILVGGFAESSIVVNTLRDELKGTVPVVRPSSPEIAVLCGAVLFGQNKEIITSRILRYTYGIGMCMEICPGESYPQDKTFDDNGKTFVNDVFRKHVSLDEEVELNRWISGLEYYPLDDKDTDTTVYVFTSKSQTPSFITDNGCECIGKLHVNFANATKSRYLKKKAVDVSFSFGGTELKVKATDRNDVSKTYQTDLNLLI